MIFRSNKYGSFISFNNVLPRALIKYLLDKGIAKEGGGDVKAMPPPPLPHPGILKDLNIFVEEVETSHIIAYFIKSYKTIANGGNLWTLTTKKLIVGSLFYDSDVFKDFISTLLIIIKIYIFIYIF